MPSKIQRHFLGTHQEVGLQSMYSFIHPVDIIQHLLSDEYCSKSIKR